MFGNTTVLEELHLTGKYRHKHAAHEFQACSRHAAWDPHRL
jgi:hypothetical protein